jgi:hypothetical protein
VVHVCAALVPDFSVNVALLMLPSSNEQMAARSLVETIQVVRFNHWSPWKVFMAMTGVRLSVSLGE